MGMRARRLLVFKINALGYVANSSGRTFIETTRKAGRKPGGVGTYPLPKRAGTQRSARNSDQNLKDTVLVLLFA